jgi:hypothetical protein
MLEGIRWQVVVVVVGLDSMMLETEILEYRV